MTAYALIGDGACPLTGAAPVPTTPVVDFRAAPEHLTRGGSVEVAHLGPKGFVTGWAPVDATKKGATLHVDTNLPLRIVSASSIPRHDVAKALGANDLDDAGFKIRFAEIPGAATPEHPRLCIWSEDPRFGIAEMQDLTAAGLCP